MTGEIHEGENPFIAPEADRDPVRRFRGRLASPITIVTAGDVEGAAGLTISSLIVAEGDPGTVHFVLGPTADVYDAIERTDRFIVHVLSERHRDLSEIFAERRPNPGGPFADLETTATEWGPAIDDVPDRAYCSGVSISEHESSLLVEATIDRIEVSDLISPLIYFRGHYRSLEE